MTTQQTKTAPVADIEAPENVHPAFEWLRSERIDSLNLVVEEYRHQKTGAQYLHLASENPENVFLVAFRTVPMDSTGVAHILEHTALCGSKHYPVRDPFFMMIRRSLNTFMNAFTSSDWTAYPFASQNKKDFNNLLDVYLDAAFFSRLHELDFAQEGHRVEFEEPENPDSDLVYKGVVFNEMKGAMSSTVSTLWQRLTEHLFPTTTYHYNSGGEPVDIPSLSYDELKEFYRTHYHPSNAVFMTYGNIPAAEHQARFEEQALKHFDRLDKVIEVSDEQRYDQPLIVEDYYALDESESSGDKTHIVLGWLLGKSTDSMDLMRAHLLSSVLLDNGASPLRRALETTDLGTAPSPLCGLEDSNREMSFMCGVEGSKPDNAEAVEQLVLGVLRDVAKNGVPQEMVEAVLHQLELHQREIKGDGYPYGLQLILEGLSPAIHRGDPVALLNLDPVLETLREEIKDPDFIKRLARTLLVENPHRVRLTMSPDTGLSQKREQEEHERLQAIKSGLSEPEKQQIVQRAKDLASRQQEEDDPEVLPKVTLDDIPAKMPELGYEQASINQIPATYYPQGTNGLVYQQYLAQLPSIEDDALPLLPYYTRCLTEVGSGGRDYLSTQMLMDAVTGGISASTSLRGAIDDVQDVRGHFVLSGKALVRNQENLARLMQETLHDIRWDEHGRIREIIAQDRARAEQSVTGNGHGLAMLAASSAMSPTAAINHRLRGLAGIQALKALDDSLNDESALTEFAEKLAAIHQQMVSAPGQFLIVGESEQFSPSISALSSIWTSQSGSGAFEPFSVAPVRDGVKQMWVTSTQVNFCAKSYPTVPIEHDDAPALAVLGGFLRNGYLHRAIREHGGAYGGGAGHEADIAAFRFFSYRDPRLTETLDDFDRSVEWLLEGKHEWRQVEEAILGVIGSIDKPSSPAGEAKKAFRNSLYGRTPEQRQRFRSKVLDVTLDDLKRVAERYLKPDSASVAVITNAATHGEIGDLGLTLNRL
jgi:Zn-dependent M16 (insulinase) family peptidase